MFQGHYVISKNIRVLPSELCPKIWTRKIWQRHVHRRQERYKQATTADVAKCCYYRPMSPVDHTRRPALVTARWSIGREEALRVFHRCQLVYLFVDGSIMLIYCIRVDTKYDHYLTAVWQGQINVCLCDTCFINAGCPKKLQLSG